MTNPPFLSNPSNPSSLEKYLQWQEQFLKGVAHGFNTQEWLLITRVIMAMSHAFVNLNTEQIENIGQAHQKGYDLVTGIKLELSKGFVNMTIPPDNEEYRNFEKWLHGPHVAEK